MSHPLTENTKLKCNKGTKETPLKVTSHSGLKINSLLKATEKDKEANTNIIPFGQCKLKPTSGGYLPCTPAIKQWEKTSPFSLNGMKKLTTDSFCMCDTGGKVSPLTPPETFINVIEKSTHFSHLKDLNDNYPIEINGLKGPTKVELFDIAEYKVTSFTKEPKFIHKTNISWQYADSKKNLYKLNEKTVKLSLFIGEINDLNKDISIYAYLYEISENIKITSRVINTVKIISRAEWGARKPDPKKGLYEKIMEPLDKFYDTIVVHHSGNEVDYPTVKQVQDKHMDSKSDSRADIGYHYAIDKDGKIYEGRDIKFKGSHVNKANTGKIGIVLLADLSTDDAGMGWRSTFEWSDGELTNKMECSLLKLCIYLDGLYGIEILAGHMEINKDRYCPGNLTMAKMNNWRKLLKMKKP